MQPDTLPLPGYYPGSAFSSYETFMAYAGNNKWMRASSVGCYCMEMYLNNTVGFSTDFGASWHEALVNGFFMFNPTFQSRITGFDARGNDAVITFKTNNSDWSQGGGSPLPPEAKPKSTFLSFSTDGGTSWSKPAQIGPEASLFASSPRVQPVASNTSGNWLLMQNEDETSSSTAQDLFSYRTNDLNTTWTGPTIVHASASENETNPALIALPAGGFLSLYQTDRTGRWTIAAARSDDGGQSWKDLGFVSPTTLHDIPGGELSIKLSFKKVGKDSVKLSGTINVPDNWQASGLDAGVNIGGVVRDFVLDAKGKGRVGKDSFVVSAKSKKGVVAAQSDRFQVSLKNGDFTGALAGYGLVDGNVNGQACFIPVTFNVGPTVVVGEIPVLYSAKAGKMGKAQ
jgi:hypothetical protein